MPTEKIKARFFPFAASRAALLLGCALTFTLYGYGFGQGNQSVYLLDALHRADPLLLARDWFTTQTLQYHFAFTTLSASLIRLGIIQPAFLTIYVGLIVLFHVAWRGIVRTLGGGDAAYLISVALYTVSAAGTGLGMYQFFQDGSLLPSNISNVLLLCGIWLWLIEKPNWAGLCFGVAGIFHLNHALVGSGMWIALCCCNFRRCSPLSRVPVGEGSAVPFGRNAPDSLRSRPRPRVRGRGEQKTLLLASAIALLPSAINVIAAARMKLARSGAMPLYDFVELYVKLRHPHHYYPASWPLGIWLAFGWSALAALLLVRGTLAKIVWLLCGLLCIGLIGAGFFYVSETLVQLSLFRFSIYVELFGCSAVGVLLARYRLIGILSSVLIVICVAIGIARGPYLGTFRLPHDDGDYVALCQWIQRNTSKNALFIVPPDEESMRLIGQRAIVVNFKGVPQLSAELIEWRKRLCTTLDLPDLQHLPRGYAHTMSALRQRYDELNVNQFLSVARAQQADYVVALHELPGLQNCRVATGVKSRYVLYDLRAASQ